MDKWPSHTHLQLQGKGAMAQPRTQLLLRLLFLLALASCVAAAAATESEAPAPARGAATTSTAKGCRRGDQVVRQRATGRVVEGKPEYAVEVRNACRCAQSRVLVRCYGLSSVEAVDPRAIRAVDGERCLLRGGRALPPRGGAVRFTYAWMTPQDFPLVSAHPHC